MERLVEQRGAQSDLQAGLIQSWRVVRVLWLVGLVMAAFLWLILPLVVSRPARSGGPAQIIGLLFYAVGLADIIVGWYLRDRAFAGARADRTRSPQQALGRIVGPSLVAITLAQTASVLGAVLYLAFGNRAGLSVLCVLSLIGLALNRPRVDQWHDILAAAGIHAHRPA
jgi:hypothetical protein